MQIVIYSTSTSSYCKLEKDYLSSKNIDFIEKNIDTNDDSRNEMSQISKGFMGVPFTNIIKDDGTNETIVGFDRGRLDTFIGN